MLQVTLEHPKLYASYTSFLIPSKEVSVSVSVSVSDLYYEHGSGGGREVTAPEKITTSEKGQGKGSYGGANIAHRRPGQKSAAVLYAPCFFTVVGFSFSLLLA
ncbi:hypothetical protein MIMGU_mgv1a016903mg [Erythranthe guttata]|uniref:Uncharacterized protein n=1 Tax=Erythranthe guttata TaxID=4155 RepID=A0A022QAF8_ERYGU|nr:hypothetical protein MIMGU_mgv1a016903mg [Erythranthe guttata]